MTALTRRGLFGLLALTVFTFTSPQFAAHAAEGSDVIGKVAKLQKPAYAMQDAIPRRLSVDSDIQLGDIISTGKGARLKIELNDGTDVTLGERTHFVMQEFIMSNSQNNAVMRLLEGAFKVTSGKIMTLANANMTVQTNTATIGIRGTTVWGGSLDGEFEVALLGGKGIFVETKGGRVDISTINDGTKILNANSSPTTPIPWPMKKVSRAMATVSFE